MLLQLLRLLLLLFALLLLLFMLLLLFFAGAAVVFNIEVSFLSPNCSPWVFPQVMKQRCSPSLSDRLRFAGDYDSHGCEIELSGLSSEADAGEWSCEMEDYVWGAIRGASHKRSLFLEVQEKHGRGTKDFYELFVGCMSHT